MANLSDYLRATGGADSFLQLTDTPTSYVGSAGKVPVVNAGESALQFEGRHKLLGKLNATAAFSTNSVIPSAVVPAPTAGALIHSLSVDVPDGMALCIRTGGQCAGVSAGAFGAVMLVVSGVVVNVGAVQFGGANWAMNYKLSAYVNNPPASATVEVRYGPNNGGQTMYINGNAGGYLFGGAERWLTTVEAVEYYV